MTELSLTILPETPKDAQAIERLHERTFGPGRFALSAYRLREHVDHLLDVSFTARIGTLLVGSVRQLPVCIGETPALMLGPLTVEPPFRSRGVGHALKARIDNAQHGMVDSGDGAARLHRRMVERVLTHCETDHSAAEPLLILLRRFATESAREDARMFCEELAAEDALAVLPSDDDLIAA